MLLLSRKIGEAAVARWCVELLVGGTSYDDPRWPSISWIGGPHAASELRRGEIDARGQEYWTRVWAARALLYAWHPAGVARSKLWAALAGSGLGVTATSRNWTTVTNLLALADEDPG